MSGSDPARATLLDGRGQWWLQPLLLANLLSVLPAAVFGWSAVHLVPGSAAQVLTLIALVVAALSLGWALRAQARSRAVQRLSAGRLTASEENMIAAIREVRSMPDWARRRALLAWPLGVAAIALGLWRLGATSARDSVLLASLAVTVGPLASVFTYLLLVRRARQVVEQAARTLPVRRVLEALQTERQIRVRTRLVFFTAIVVLCSAALVALQSRIESGSVLAQVAAAPRVEQAAVATVATRAAEGRVLLLAGLLMALALGAAGAVGGSIADPMREVAEEANRISRGDLRDVRVVAAEGEVWAVTSTFTQMHAQLHEVIGALQRAGISIGSTTEQLMATSSRYESGAAEQASSLNETSATTEELAQSARQISQNAGSVADLAQKTLDAARDGQGSAEAFVNAVERMKHDNQSIAEAVTRLQRRVQQIGRIVEFITTVADRSDLLALSAELEGTKAGDVGRGFTLVAAEMRRLAENVIESTNEIEELIGEIREATEATVGATARGMEHTQSGTSLAGDVSVALSKVVELAQGTADSVRAISLATQQQQSSTDQLAEAMADILGITQQSLAATKQVTSANHELITLSADLKALVDRFQLKQGRA